MVSLHRSHLRHRMMSLHRSLLKHSMVSYSAYRFLNCHNSRGTRLVVATRISDPSGKPDVLDKCPFSYLHNRLSDEKPSRQNRTSESRSAASFMFRDLKILESYLDLTSFFMSDNPPSSQIGRAQSPDPITHSLDQQQLPCQHSDGKKATP